MKTKTILKLILLAFNGISFCLAILYLYQFISGVQPHDFNVYYIPQLISLILLWLFYHWLKYLIKIAGQNSYIAYPLAFFFSSLSIMQYLFLSFFMPLLMWYLEPFPNHVIWVDTIGFASMLLIDFSFYVGFILSLLAWILSPFSTNQASDLDW